ncbi:hypothetical protein HDU93_004297, partial [Gonapodya sp. JEL0774]
SGETPLEPVLNVKSGHVYEKRLATKFVQDNKKDPVTGVDSTLEDLVDVKTTLPAARPRPATATSIPSLLNLFQNEWDSLMLETFSLKQQHAQLRRELSAALYENDAARRVIARVVKERDEARRALANVQATFAAAGVDAGGASAKAPGEGADAMDVDEGISPEIIEKLTETSAGLSKVRRKRKPPPTLATAEQLTTYKPTALPQPASTKSSAATAMDILLSAQLAITGHVSGLLSVHDL